MIQLEIDDTVGTRSSGDDTDGARSSGTINIRTTCQKRPLLCITILIISTLFVYDIGLRIGLQIQIMVRLFSKKYYNRVYFVHVYPFIKTTQYTLTYIFFCRKVKKWKPRMNPWSTGQSTMQQTTHPRTAMT